MRNVFIPYSASPHQTDLLWTYMPLKDFSEKSPNLLAGFHLKNFLKCTVFVWGKVVVYAFPCQFKHLILQCFYSSLREKQSCKESHNDTALGMYSHVNRIMEFFVCLGLRLCFQLFLSTPFVERPFISLVERCLVNRREECAFCLSAFSLHSAPAWFCHM